MESWCVPDERSVRDWKREIEDDTQVAELHGWGYRAAVHVQDLQPSGAMPWMP